MPQLPHDLTEAVDRLRRARAAERAAFAAAADPDTGQVYGWNDLPDDVTEALAELCKAADAVAAAFDRQVSR